MKQLGWVGLTLMISLITNPHSLEALMKALKGLLKKELGFFYQSLFQLKEYLAVPSKAMSLPIDIPVHVFQLCGTWGISPSSTLSMHQ